MHHTTHRHWTAKQYKAPPPVTVRCVWSRHVCLRDQHAEGVATPHNIAACNTILRPLRHDSLPLATLGRAAIPGAPPHATGSGTYPAVVRAYKRCLSALWWLFTCQRGDPSDGSQMAFRWLSTPLDGSWWPLMAPPHLTVRSSVTASGSVVGGISLIRPTRS